MIHADSAYKCFVENIKLFGDAQTQPEKYNLYNGLANLAQALRDLENDVHRLRIDVSNLMNK